MTVDDGPPPSFVRRHLAATTEEPDVLVGLACDDSMWVRREAARNSATPAWVLDLLVRAGAGPDLRGRRTPDSGLPAAELRRLVECGPWAQQLVADHPNTTEETLDALVRHPSARVRASVAAHLNTSTEALAVLCADADDGVRQRATSHPYRPVALVELMRRADTEDGLALDEVATLGRLGPWGRYLAGRQRSCPTDLLAFVAIDPDWRVRSAVLDNPATPDDMLAGVAGSAEAESARIEELRWLSDPGATADRLRRLAEHPQAEVRLAVSRHGRTTTDVIGLLAVDRVADVRRAAAAHRLMDPVDLSLLVRAGSTSDLARLADPDPSVTAADLETLSAGGYWARQLAVRHPDTPPATLARLLCDDDPKLREWAAAHPSVPTDVVALLRRAGAAEDFQGIAEPDPEMTADELRRVESLGTYGAWVASWHPVSARCQPLG